MCTQGLYEECSAVKGLGRACMEREKDKLSEVFPMYIKIGSIFSIACIFGAAPSFVASGICEATT